jgi:conjugal transfer mating pair stabilization protein TraG
VADTLERDVMAIMVQTGWQRSLSRSAEHSTANSQSISGDLTASAARGVGSDGKGSAKGSLSGRLSAEISDRGISAVVARSSIDIVNYDVREAIASAEKAAARSSRPEETFLGNSA